MPPFNEEAEQQLLVCALIAPTYVVPLARDVEPVDFHSERHRILWRAIQSLHGQHGDFDTTSLRGYLSDKGLTEEAGGDDYFSLLASTTQGITGSAADLYIGRVKEWSAKRDAFAAGARIMEASQDGVSRGELIGLMEREAAFARAVHAPRKSAWRTFDGDDLVREPEEMLLHYWPGLVVAQHVLLLAGTAKTGKSWLLYAFLGAMSRKESWLGHPEPHEPVIPYIVSEEPRSRVRAKLARFGVRGAKGLARGDIPSSASWDETVEYAGEEAKRFGCGIVLFDTLAGLAHMEEENSNSEGNRALHPVLQMAGRIGTANIVSHHAPNALRRSGRPTRLLRAVDFVRGAGSLAANPDALAGLDNDTDPDGPRRLIVAEGRFDLPAMRQIIEYRRGEEGEPATYVVVGRPADVAERAADEIELAKAEAMDVRIVGFLERNTGKRFTRGKIRERLTLGARAEARINTLADMGKIGRAEGLGARDPDQFYALPAPTP